MSAERGPDTPRTDALERRAGGFRFALVVLFVGTLGCFAYLTVTVTSNTQAIARNAEAIARHTARDSAERARIETQLIVSEEAQITASCHRLNIERAATNINAYQAYKFDRALVNIALPPSSRPTYAIAAAEKVWVPLTDCKQASTEGANYDAPASVLFRRMPPPRSALTLGPDN